jgi:hypothetical protein
MTIGVTVHGNVEQLYPIVPLGWVCHRFGTQPMSTIALPFRAANRICDRLPRPYPDLAVS